MPSLDVFNNDAFSLQEMTKAVNIIPNNYGKIRELGIFNEKGVTTTTVTLELKEGALSILPQVQRKGEPTYEKDSKRKFFALNIPSYKHNDRIYADDIQNIRAFGSESMFETVANKVAEKLENIAKKHQITLEYMRCGALQGKVKDGEGNIIADLHSIFGVTQKSINFSFDSNDSPIDEFCRNVKRHIETELKGETMSFVQALCSPEFFDKFVKHPKVKEAYNTYQGQTPYREDFRKGFQFQGILFEEYLGSATLADGKTNVKFVPEGEAMFFPMGTTNTFDTYFAPATYEETVNTTGLPIYVKQIAEPDGESRKILSQSHPLPICKRPALLVRGYSSK